jgi:hypothetical protein
MAEGCEATVSIDGPIEEVFDFLVDQGDRPGLTSSA